MRPLGFSALRKWPAVRATLTGTAALGASVALTAVSAWLLARAWERPPILTLTVAIVAVRLFGISRGILRYLHRLDSHGVALGETASLRTALYVRLTHGVAEAALRLRRGELLARLGSDVDAVGEATVRGWMPLAVGLTTVAGTALAVAVALPAAGWALATALLLGGIVAPLLSATASQAAEHRVTTARGQVSARVLELLDNAEELTVSGGADIHFKALAREEKNLSRAIERTARVSGLAAGLTQLAIGIAVLGSAYAGLDAFEQGQLGLPMLALVALTPLAAAEGLSLLSPAAAAIASSSSSTQRLETLVEGASDPPATQSFEGSIVAEGLSCGWGRTPALEQVSLELSPGKSLAIVGPSGCGKSTLLLTLAGLLKPLEGTLRCPNRPRVVLTAEDAHLFETTLLENLRAARAGVSEAEAISALERMGLREWLAALPDGLATRLGPNGHPVSGGERRRILLARAWLTEASFLLLDEATEHLDSQTADQLVADLLRATAGKRALVMVTHRCASLAGFDEVLVLQPGASPEVPSRVVARGAPRDLLEVLELRSPTPTVGGDGGIARCAK